MPTNTTPSPSASEPDCTCEDYWHNPTDHDAKCPISKAMSIPTASERAERVVKSWYIGPEDEHQYRDELVRSITSEITAAEQAARPQWLPIESAPKDGSEVLLMVERRAGIAHKMLVGHYMPGGYCIEDHPAIDEGWYFWSGSMFDRASKPTHWMLLPEPPSKETV